MTMCGGVKAVSRTAVWCQAPSELGKKLAMKYSTTLVAPMSPQKTTMRRTSSSRVMAWAMVRPLRTSQAHQPIVPMPTPTSSRISRLRQYSANSGHVQPGGADQRGKPGACPDAVSPAAPPVGGTVLPLGGGSLLDCYRCGCHVCELLTRANNDSARHGRSQ